MPSAAPRICMAQGCKSYIVNKGYCQQHQQESKQYDRQRGNAYQRGYDSQWRKARVGYLSSHPLCVACAKQGLVVAASVVDHIAPHKGDKELFWDSVNWQALCKPCHNSKTATEDMGAWSPKNKG